MVVKGKLAVALHIDNEVRSVLVEMANQFIEEYSIGLSACYRLETSLMIDIVFYSLYYCTKTKQTPGMTIFCLKQYSDSGQHHPVFMISYLIFCYALQKAKYTAMMEGKFCYFSSIFHIYNMIHGMA